MDIWFKSNKLLSRFKYIGFTILVFLFIQKNYLLQQYSFVPFSVEEGLAQTQISDICTDDFGNIWFATAGGASKFDGNSFVNYSSENGLVDNSVAQIVNTNGFVWVATQYGFSRIKNKQIKTYSLERIMAKNSISAFAVSDNFIWVGVKNMGIIQIPLEDNFPLIDNYLVHQPTEELSIRSIYKDSKGKIWVGSKGYLGYYSDGQWNKIDIPGSSMNISDIAEDTKGNMWISTYHEGVFELTADSSINYNTEFGILSDWVRSIFIDADNAVWLSSKTGVSVIEKGGYKNFTQKNGLENENIKVTGQDLDGNIWLGSDGSGAYKFSGDEFVNYSTTDGLAGDYVMSIIQDSMGSYWFSTYGEGLSRYDEFGFTNYNNNNSVLCNNTMWSSLLDHKNQLWFGTSGGLMKYSKNKFEAYTNVDWLPSNKVTSLFEDSENKIWIGTSMGVTIISENQKIVYTDSNGLNTKNIRAIEEYKDEIWLGSSDGIYVNTDNKFEPWKQNKAIDNGIVYCLQTWKENIFIGTGSGLYYYDGIYVYPIKLHPSYSANYINFIELEDENHLWVGTNYGIFEIDLKNFSPDKIIETHYTTADGLTSSETNLNSAFLDKYGNMWMGTGKGLIKFDRQKRKVREKVVPIVSITDVQLFLQQTEWNEYSDSINPYSLLPMNLSVKYRKNYFTFYYDAVSINRPEELRYKIKLDGFDDDWSPEIFQNSVTYGNLPHGVFTFNVMTSIDGKNWSESDSFSFEILKPYYLTWWFFTMVAVVFLSLVYFIWKRNVKIQNQKRETEKLMYKSRLLELEQQTLNASMNRHFIFNALNSIQYYINSQDKLSANKYLTSFAKLIRKNLDSSSSGSSLVPLSEELERLELYISLEHMRFQNKFDYSITIAPEIDTESIMIPPMFLQPFVENSIWHGILPMEKGGLISINIGYNEAHQINFIIEDNGIGIDKSLAQKNKHSHVSKGMSITTGRLNLLKKVTNKSIHIEGPYQINDKDGNALGTRVVITLEENQKEKT